MSKGTLLIPSRRRILHFGMAGVGTTFLAGCAGMGGLAGNLMGGGGEKVDWTTLGNEFAGHLRKIADQTDSLLRVQALYASTAGLDEEAARLTALAENFNSSDPMGIAEFDEFTNATINAANAVADKLREVDALDEQKKQALASGQERHAQAIRNMWGGVVGIGLTLVKATNAAPPSISDIALFDTFKEITQTGPKAIAFGETSVATHTEYVEAFERVAVYVPPKDREMASSLDSIPL